MFCGGSIGGEGDNLEAVRCCEHIHQHAGAVAASTVIAVALAVALAVVANKAEAVPTDCSFKGVPGELLARFPARGMCHEVPPNGRS